MPHLRLLAVLAALAATALPAQRKLDARSFLPSDYNGEVRVDLARIVDCGMWDPVERSMFRMLFAGFRSEMGFDVADLDSVRFAIRMTRDEDGSNERVGAWILEGSERVDLARLPEDRRARFDETTTDGVTWLHDEWETEMVGPRPGLVVIGSGGLIGSILRGDAKPGVPVPELQALTAVPNTLASIAALFPPPDRRRPYDLSPIPADWLTTDDPPLAVRLRLATDAALENVSLEMLLQFESGEAGPTRFEEELRALRGNLESIDESLKPIAVLLADLQFLGQGRDLLVTLPLGDPEHAANRLVDLASKVLPAALLSSDVEAPAKVLVEVEAQEAEEMEEPLPPPAKKKGEGREEDGR